MVCPGKQHLGRALRRWASCCPLCEKIFRAHFWWQPCDFCLVTKGFTLPFWNKIFKYLFLLYLPGKIWTLANRREDSRAVEYFLLARCVPGSMSEGYFGNISMVDEERLTPHLCTCLGETQPPPSLWYGVLRKNKRKYSSLNINLAYGSSLPLEVRGEVQESLCSLPFK